ncbi:hypothetical protein R6Q59_018654 [Mikania micrantha]
MKKFIFFLLLLYCISTSSSSPFSISDGIFTSEASIGRNLLQNTKTCNLNFEMMNYTIITSRCKGPQYNATSCCDAFKVFACPNAVYLNDSSNDCTSKMFDYIYFYGNYTRGLFATLCRDDKVGLICPATPPVAEGNNVGADSNNHHSIRGSSLLTLSVGFLILFVWV